MKYVEQEIRIHSQLSHKNIVRLYKVIWEGNFIHLILEYASKGSLFDYMQRQRKLKDEQIAYVFKGVCEGMQYIHQMSILHRDLKPENILFDEHYTPKIADFGFACKIKKHERRQTICGTREYFSPELFTYKNQTLALDVWCLGILLYEMCHNKVPFKMTSFSFKEAAEKIRNQQYNCNLNIDPLFKDVITACLLFEPSERPKVNELLTFDFISLVKNSSSSSMHYKRTSASQTPNVRNVTKQFDISKYLKDQKTRNLKLKDKPPIQKPSPKLEFVKDAGSVTGKSPFESGTEVGQSSGFYKKIVKISVTKDQKKRVYASPTPEKKRLLSPENGKFVESKKQENEVYPRRWNKVLKSVDLKAKNNQNRFPRQERIRIIKSPPPNVNYSPFKKFRVFF